MAKVLFNDVIKIAKSQVGYLEKKTNKDLDSFTANAGSNNFTKYAREYAVFSGSNMQGQAWCDMFVDWCFVQVYGKDKAKSLLIGFSGYTPTSAQYFKNVNRWYTKTPHAGDIIFFKNSERINHTGIVVKVSKTTVYTVEGNTSGGSAVIENGGGVCAKSYTLSNARIAGYGRPAYDDEFNNVDWTKRLQKSLNIKVDGKNNDATYKATVTIKRGDNNIPIIKLIQEKMTAFGYYDFVINGKYGKEPYREMFDSIILFQKECVGLKNPDSEFTKQGSSWKTLLSLE